MIASRIGSSFKALCSLGSSFAAERSASFAGPGNCSAAPAGVEVYKDGAYIGISPISFAKKQGIYTITLRRDGYQTRSYTVEIDYEKNNVNYSFSELVEIR